jgi:phage shock protein C
MSETVRTAKVNVSSGSLEVGMGGLRRAKRDRWIMGVCGGIAHRYGWNSTMVRLVTIILAIIIPGFSVVPTLLVYFLLGYLLPETDEF